MGGWITRKIVRDFGFLLVASLAFSTSSVGAVKADFEGSKAWFNSLDLDARYAIQTALVLTAQYGGLIDAEHGNGTFNAIQRFENSIRSAPDGILNDQELGQLEAQASSVIDNLGLEDSVDRKSNLSFILAKKLLVTSEEEGHQTVYSSADAKIALTIWTRTDEPFEATFGKAVVAGAHRSIAYSQLNDDRFTVSGTSDNTFFYTRGIRGEGRTVGFSIQYDPLYRKTGGVLAVLLASLSALPSALNEVDSTAPTSGDPAPQSVSSGSGFFISGSGTILTNFHVAGNCTSLEVPGYGAAELLAGDASVDLAVVQIDNKVQTPWAQIRSEPVQLAESVVLVGYPLADILDYALNVSTGVVSSLSGLTDTPWFTTNAGIQPGNSGGPILDSQGVVVGVAVAKIDDAKMLREIGSTAPNVGFGIRTDEVLKFLEIFDHSEATPTNDPALSPQQIAAKAKPFTVMLICREGEHQASN